MMMTRTLWSNASNTRVLSGDEAQIIETTTITGTKVSRMKTRTKWRSRKRLGPEDTGETRVAESAEPKLAVAISPDLGPG